MLFLGCRIFDPALRHTLYTLLKTPLETHATGELYAVIQRPKVKQGDHYQELESRIWDNLKKEALNRYHIEILEIDPDEFLTRLFERIKRQWTV